MIPPFFIFLVPVIGEPSRAARSSTNRRAFAATGQCTDSRSRSGTNASPLYRLLLSIAFGVIVSFDVMASLMMVIVGVGLLCL
jgi:hypothetical protein